MSIALERPPEAEAPLARFERTRGPRDASKALPAIAEEILDVSERERR